MKKFKLALNIHVQNYSIPKFCAESFILYKPPINAACECLDASVTTLLESWPILCLKKLPDHW